MCPCVICWIVTDVSEERVDFITRVVIFLFEQSDAFVIVL
jgi:hypothetical protein